MKRITFALTFFLLSTFFNYGSELPDVTSDTKNISQGFSYNVQTSELERFKSGIVVNKDTIKSNKRGFYFAAIGLSIGSGLVLTTAIASSITVSVLSLTYYASPAHIAMIGLSSACWTFFLFFIAPVAVAMWILYGFALKYERENGSEAALLADKESFGVRLRLPSNPL